MRLRDLRAFKEIMNTRSLSAAAERLHLTQPAISKRLSALETALNLRLIDRRGGGPALPTEAGAAFYRAIESLLTGIDSIPQIAGDIATRTYIPIRIAVTPPILNSAPMMEALRKVTARFPNIRLSLESRHRLEMEESITTRQVEIGLGLMPVDNPHLRCLTLLNTSAVAVLRADHPLAGRSSLSAYDLQGEKLILPSRQPLRDRLNASFISHEVPMKAFIESSSTVSCCKLAAEGFGVAICDPLTPSMYNPGVIKALAWSPRINLTYGALLHRSSILDPVVTEVLDILREEFMNWEHGTLPDSRKGAAYE